MGKFKFSIYKLPFKKNSVEELNKPMVGRRQEIIKIRVKVNAIGNRKAMGNISFSENTEKMQISSKSERGKKKECNNYQSQE
jgi:hypothetical protein